jgi:hypothetical protein
LRDSALSLLWQLFQKGIESNPRKHSTRGNTLSPKHIKGAVKKKLPISKL